MALTVEILTGALRIGETPEEAAEVERLLSVAVALVEDHASTAPEPIADEAAIRIAAYLFDMPNAGRGASYANVVRNSGAGALLLPWRIQRAGSTAEAVAMTQDSIGTPGNPVVNVQVVGSDLVISFADGTVDTQALPAGDGTPGQGSGVDQTARDAAAAAQTTADAATTENEATALISPFAREAAATTDVMPAARLAENPAEDNVPLVVSGGRSLRWVHRNTLGTNDQVARQAAADAQDTADIATTPAEARVEARIAMEPWARLGNTTLIPGDQVDLSGISVSAEDDAARAQAAANAEAITEIEAGEHTITPAGLLPAVSGAHPRTIYGLGPINLSAITLHFLKRSVAHRFTIRLDNLTINVTTPLYTATGWASTPVANQYKAGGRIYPQQPSGLFGLVRMYDRAANNFFWRMHKPDAAPLHDALGDLVTDDDIWLTFYHPDTGAQHGQPVNMIRTGNQSHYFSVAAVDDPALLNVHQVVEVEFGSTNDIQRERYDLGFDDNHLSQLLDDESALALEGFAHSEVESLREAIKPFARKDSAVHETPGMQDLGRFIPADITDIANGAEGTFVYTGVVQRDTDGTLAYLGGKWTALEDTQGVGTAADWAAEGNTDPIPAGKLINAPDVGARTTLGHYDFDLQGANNTFWAISTLTVPAAGRLHVWFTTLEWDHVSQSVDRIYEATAAVEVSVAALRNTTDRANAFAAIQSDPDAMPDTFFGVSAVTGAFSFQLAMLPNDRLMIGTAGATADNSWTGRMHVEAS